MEQQEVSPAGADVALLSAPRTGRGRHAAPRRAVIPRPRRSPDAPPALAPAEAPPAAPALPLALLPVEQPVARAEQVVLAYEPVLPADEPDALVGLTLLAELYDEPAALVEPEPEPSPELRQELQQVPLPEQHSAPAPSAPVAVRPVPAALDVLPDWSTPSVRSSGRARRTAERTVRVREVAPTPAPAPTHRQAPAPPTTLPRKRLRAGKAGRAGHLLLDVVLVVVVIAFLALAIGPRTGAYRTTTMLTGSMRPLYPPGSVLLLVPQDAADLAPGQVITFRAPVEDKRVVTHRVVSVDHSGPTPVIVTKGDANNGNDPWVATVTSDKVWRVKGVVPYLGRAIQELRRPTAQLVLTRGLPGVLLVVVLVAIWRPSREES
jgi:signal peptidase